MDLRTRLSVIDLMTEETWSQAHIAARMVLAGLDAGEADRQAALEDAVGDGPARALVRIPCADLRRLGGHGLQFARLAEVVGEEDLVRDEQLRPEIRRQGGEGEEGEENGAHGAIRTIHRWEASGCMPTQKSPGLLRGSCKVG